MINKILAALIEVTLTRRLFPFSIKFRFLCKKKEKLVKKKDNLSFTNSSDSSQGMFHFLYTLFILSETCTSLPWKQSETTRIREENLIAAGSTGKSNLTETSIVKSSTKNCAAVKENLL